MIYHKAIGVIGTSAIGPKAIGTIQWAEKYPVFLGLSVFLEKRVENQL